MKHEKAITGIFWLLVGLVLSVWSTRYQIGGLLQPGPGFLPLMYGLVLILLSLALLLGRVRAPVPAGAAPAGTGSRGWVRVTYTVLILFLATYLFEKLGYLVTILLMIFLLMWRVTSKGWRSILLVAVLSAACTYFLFVLLLKQQLPRGLLGF